MGWLAREVQLLFVSCRAFSSTDFRFPRRLVIVDGE